LLSLKKFLPLNFFFDWKITSHTKCCI
jgi:hypothetical protein